MRLPILEAFDQPDRLNSCPRRTCTTTAPQALEMLNSDLTEDLAQRWSGKLIKECGGDEAKLVRKAYTEAYARDATNQEVQAAEEFMNRQTAEVSFGEERRRQVFANAIAGVHGSREGGRHCGFLPCGFLLERVLVRGLSRR